MRSLRGRPWLHARAGRQGPHWLHAQEGLQGEGCPGNDAGRDGAVRQGEGGHVQPGPSCTILCRHQAVGRLDAGVSSSRRARAGAHHQRAQGRAGGGLSHLLFRHHRQVSPHTAAGCRRLGHQVQRRTEAAGAHLVCGPPHQARRPHPRQAPPRAGACSAAHAGKCVRLCNSTSGSFCGLAAGATGQEEEHLACRVCSRLKH
mmetsp:Transcript_26877/g.67609  ORF Transcript_26877/g.67609 Transcript_26877/m.67609 type:complete len:202 (-) Transcript_26877:77-682(-)